MDSEKAELLVEKMQKLEEENKRLREGRFTDPELQNLCHNLDEKDERAFSAGCVEYQKKLFGRCSLLEDYKRMEKKLDFIKQYVKSSFNFFKDCPHGTYEQGRARESRDIMRILEQLDEDFDEKQPEK